ncbi:MAG: metallophosphoesterase family protein [Bryobacteraceae bacterium]|nr:metallophosphoesterase family protein [Bryobacteraceae bacterium]
MRGAPSAIGLISDTHGLLREEALSGLEGSDLIIHAGDVGDPAILERLNRVARVVAVRGNIDHGAWATALPETAAVVGGAARIFVIHNVHDLPLDPAAAGFHVVVSGHSHRPGQSERGGVLYVNPGSAGPRRFRLPVTVARLNISAAPFTVEFIELSNGPPRKPSPRKVPDPSARR